MKTLSFDDLEAFVARDGWHSEEAHEVAGSEDLDNVTHIWGWAEKKSKLDDVIVSYTEFFSFKAYEPDSLSTGPDEHNDTWRIEGVSIVDEYGNGMSGHELSNRLDHLSRLRLLKDEFSHIDYRMLEIGEVVDVDVDEDVEANTFTLEIDNAPSIRFTGEIVASAASFDNGAEESLCSGVVGRWTELELYKTMGGKFVCHEVERTRWDGERDGFRGEVCETMEDVKVFFGKGWLVEYLYENAKSVMQ